MARCMGQSIPSGFASTYRAALQPETFFGGVILCAQVKAGEAVCGGKVHTYTRKRYPFELKATRGL